MVLLGVTDLFFFIHECKVVKHGSGIFLMQLARQAVVYVSTEHQLDVLERGLAYFGPEVLGEPELEFFDSALPVT